jgi:hypothetical protein
MLMNPWKRIYMTLMLLMAVLLVLTVCASSVLAQDSAVPPGPPPHPPFAQGLAKGDYLYVLDMRSIHQYYLKDVSLKQTVPLPDLPAPLTQAVTDARPPMPPRSSFLIEENELFVFEMRSIHKYNLPSLEFVTTTTLPIPDLPQ